MLDEEKERYDLYYPELSEEGKKRTAKIIEQFREQMFNVINSTMSQFTSTIADEIVDDDAWIDIRQKTKEALCGYPTEGQYRSVNWVQIRKKILEENKESITSDLLKDKEIEIQKLKETIEFLNKHR